jgi:hypothetical protein
MSVGVTTQKAAAATEAVAVAAAATAAAAAKVIAAATPEATTSAAAAAAAAAAGVVAAAKAVAEAEAEAALPVGVAAGDAFKEHLQEIITQIDLGSMRVVYKQMPAGAKRAKQEKDAPKAAGVAPPQIATAAEFSAQSLGTNPLAAKLLSMSNQ